MMATAGAPPVVPPARQVLALIDDAALAARVIEMASTLAAWLHRPLELVYVESAQALLAAALPVTQVLTHGGTRWQPFGPQDVEGGYRAQAARLQGLLERLTARHAVQGSMRVVRGALLQAALELRPQTDLMFVGRDAGLPARAAPARPGRRPVVTAIVDDSAAGQEARLVAQQLAEALDGVLIVRHAGADAFATATAAHAGPSDLLVLPNRLAAPGLLARLAQPVLLVG